MSLNHLHLQSTPSSSPSPTPTPTSTLQATLPNNVIEVVQTNVRHMLRRNKGFFCSKLNAQMSSNSSCGASLKGFSTVLLVCLFLVPWSLVCGDDLSAPTLSSLSFSCDDNSTVIFSPDFSPFTFSYTLQISPPLNPILTPTGYGFPEPSCFVQAMLNVLDDSAHDFNDSNVEVGIENLPRNHTVAQNYITRNWTQLESSGLPIRFRYFGYYDFWLSLAANVSESNETVPTGYPTPPAQQLAWPVLTDYYVNALRLPPRIIYELSLYANDFPIQASPAFSPLIFSYSAVVVVDNYTLPADNGPIIPLEFPRISVLAVPNTYVTNYLLYSLLIAPNPPLSIDDDLFVVPSDWLYNGTNSLQLMIGYNNPGGSLLGELDFRIIDIDLTVIRWPAVYLSDMTISGVGCADPCLSPTFDKSLAKYNVNVNIVDSDLTLSLKFPSGSISAVVYIISTFGEEPCCYYYPEYNGVDVQINLNWEPELSVLIVLSYSDPNQSATAQYQLFVSWVGPDWTTTTNPPAGNTSYPPNSTPSIDTTAPSDSSSVSSSTIIILVVVLVVSLLICFGAYELYKRRTDERPKPEPRPPRRRRNASRRSRPHEGAAPVPQVEPVHHISSANRPSSSFGSASDSPSSPHASSHARDDHEQRCSLGAVSIHPVTVLPDKDIRSGAASPLGFVRYVPAIELSSLKRNQIEGRAHQPNEIRDEDLSVAYGHAYAAAAGVGVSDAAAGNAAGLLSFAPIILPRTPRDHWHGQVHEEDGGVRAEGKPEWLAHPFMLSSPAQSGVPYFYASAAASMGAPAGAYALIVTPLPVHSQQVQPQVEHQDQYSHSEQQQQQLHQLPPINQPLNQPISPLSEAPAMPSGSRSELAGSQQISASATVAGGGAGNVIVNAESEPGAI